MRSTYLPCAALPNPHLGLQVVDRGHRVLAHRLREPTSSLGYIFASLTVSRLPMSRSWLLSDGPQSRPLHLHLWSNAYLRRYCSGGALLNFLQTLEHNGQPQLNDILDRFLSLHQYQDERQTGTQIF